MDHLALIKIVQIVLGKGTIIHTHSWGKKTYSKGVQSGGWKCIICGKNTWDAANLWCVRDGCDFSATASAICIADYKGCLQKWVNSFSKNDTVRCTSCGGSGKVWKSTSCSHGKYSSHSYCSHGYTSQHD